MRHFDKINQIYGFCSKCGGTPCECVTAGHGSSISSVSSTDLLGQLQELQEQMSRGQPSSATKTATKSEPKDAFKPSWEIEDVEEEEDMNAEITPTPPLEDAIRSIKEALANEVAQNIRDGNIETAHDLLNMSVNDLFNHWS